jgi:endoglucanase
MHEDSLSFLRELMSVSCPSGFEQPGQRVMRERMKNYADRVQTDVHGSVMGVLNEDAKLRVMLAGHVDEIGFMVQHIDEKGFLSVGTIGGNDQTMCAGKRVIVHGPKGPVLGVFGKKAIHLMKPDERDKAMKLRDLWIDIGATDKEDAESVVEIGDPITYTYGFEEMRNGMVVGRGFDDRAGAFVVAETLRLLSEQRDALKVAVFGVSTVQEEIGLRGARTSAFGVDPDVGIAIDVEFASDHPNANEKEIGTVHLGKGPVVTKGANVNPEVLRRLRQASENGDVPIQLVGVGGATGTDANAIQVTRSGVAAGLLGVPNRYMHTPVEMVHLDDLENCARLLARFILDLDADTSFIPE